MNDKVLVKIKGIQYDLEENNEGIETMQHGEYKYILGKHVIAYDEIFETEDGAPPATSKNLLMITKDSVSLVKRGVVSSDMFFKERHNHTGIYEFPYGSMHMNLSTTKLTINESEDRIDVNIKYGLDMNYSHVSDCEISICITSV